MSRSSSPSSFFFLNESRTNLQHPPTPFGTHRIVLFFLRVPAFQLIQITASTSGGEDDHGEDDHSYDEMTPI